MIIITFKIDPNLLEQLDAQARREGASRSEIIRRAIVFYLKQYGKEKKPRIRIVEC